MDALGVIQRKLDALGEASQKAEAEGVTDPSFWQSQIDRRGVLLEVEMELIEEGLRELKEALSCPLPT